MTIKLDQALLIVFRGELPGLDKPFDDQLIPKSFIRIQRLESPRHGRHIIGIDTDGGVSGDFGSKIDVCLGSGPIDVMRSI